MVVTKRAETLGGYNTQCSNQRAGAAGLGCAAPITNRLECAQRILAHSPRPHREDKAIFRRPHKGRAASATPSGCLTPRVNTARFAAAGARLPTYRWLQASTGLGTTQGHRQSLQPTRANPRTHSAAMSRRSHMLARSSLAGPPAGRARNSTHGRAPQSCRATDEVLWDKGRPAPPSPVLRRSGPAARAGGPHRESESRVRGLKCRRREPSRHRTLGRPESWRITTTCAGAAVVRKVTAVHRPGYAQGLALREAGGTANRSDSELGQGRPGAGGRVALGAGAVSLRLEDGLVQELGRVLVEALAQLAVFDEQPQRLDVQPLLHRHLRISLMLQSIYALCNRAALIPWSFTVTCGEPERSGDTRTAPWDGTPVKLLAGGSACYLGALLHHSINALIAELQQSSDPHRSLDGCRR